MRLDIFMAWRVLCAWPMPQSCPDKSAPGQLLETPRVQVPNSSELWSQRPFRVWYLGPGSLTIGYLDPLGTIEPNTTQR